MRRKMLMFGWLIALSVVHNARAETSETESKGDLVEDLRPRSKRQPFHDYLHYLLDKHALCADQHLAPLKPKGSFMPYDMFVYPYGMSQPAGDRRIQTMPEPNIFPNFYNPILPQVYSALNPPNIKPPICANNRCGSRTKPKPSCREQQRNGAAKKSSTKVKQSRLSKENIKKVVNKKSNSTAVDRHCPNCQKGSSQPNSSAHVVIVNLSANNCTCRNYTTTSLEGSVIAPAATLPTIAPKSKATLNAQPRPFSSSPRTKPGDDLSSPATASSTNTKDDLSKRVKSLGPPLSTTYTSSVGTEDTVAPRSEASLNANPRPFSSSPRTKPGDDLSPSLSPVSAFLGDDLSKTAVTLRPSLSTTPSASVRTEDGFTKTKDAFDRTVSSDNFNSPTPIPASAFSSGTSEGLPKTLESSNAAVPPASASSRTMSPSFSSASPHRTTYGRSNTTPLPSPSSVSTTTPKVSKLPLTQSVSPSASTTALPIANVKSLKQKDDNVNLQQDVISDEELFKTIAAAQEQNLTTIVQATNVGSQQGDLTQILLDQKDLQDPLGGEKLAIVDLAHISEMSANDFENQPKTEAKASEDRSKAKGNSNNSTDNNQTSPLVNTTDHLVAVSGPPGVKFNNTNSAGLQKVTEEIHNLSRASNDTDNMEPFLIAGVLSELEFPRESTPGIDDNVELLPESPKALSDQMVFSDERFMNTNLDRPQQIIHVAVKSNGKFESIHLPQSISTSRVDAVHQVNRSEAIKAVSATNDKRKGISSSDSRRKGEMKFVSLSNERQEESTKFTKNHRQGAVNVMTIQSEPILGKPKSNNNPEETPRSTSDSHRQMTAVKVTSLSNTDTQGISKSTSVTRQKGTMKSISNESQEASTKFTAEINNNRQGAVNVTTIQRESIISKPESNSNPEWTLGVSTSDFHRQMGAVKVTSLSNTDTQVSHPDDNQVETPRSPSNPQLQGRVNSFSIANANQQERATLSPEANQKRQGVVKFVAFSVENPEKPSKSFLENINKEMEDIHRQGAVKFVSITNDNEQERTKDERQGAVKFASLSTENGSSSDTHRQIVSSSNNNSEESTKLISEVNGNREDILRSSSSSLGQGAVKSFSIANDNQQQRTKVERQGAFKHISLSRKNESTNNSDVTLRSSSDTNRQLAAKVISISSNTSQKVTKLVSEANGNREGIPRSSSSSLGQGAVKFFSIANDNNQQRSKDHRQGAVKFASLSTEDESMNNSAVTPRSSSDTHRQMVSFSTNNSQETTKLVSEANRQDISRSSSNSHRQGAVKFFSIANDNQEQERDKSTSETDHKRQGVATFAKFSTGSQQQTFKDSHQLEAANLEDHKRQGVAKFTSFSTENQQETFKAAHKLEAAKLASLSNDKQTKATKFASELSSIGKESLEPTSDSHRKLAVEVISFSNNNNHHESNNKGQGAVKLVSFSKDYDEDPSKSVSENDNHKQGPPSSMSNTKRKIEVKYFTFSSDNEEEPSKVTSAANSNQNGSTRSGLVKFASFSNDNPQESSKLFSESSSNHQGAIKFASFSNDKQKGESTKSILKSNNNQKETSSDSHQQGGVKFVSFSNDNTPEDPSKSIFNTNNNREDSHRLDVVKFLSFSNDKQGKSTKLISDFLNGNGKDKDSKSNSETQRQGAAKFFTFSSNTQKGFGKEISETKNNEQEPTGFIHDSDPSMGVVSSISNNKNNQQTSKKQRWSFNFNKNREDHDQFNSDSINKRLRFFGLTSDFDDDIINEPLTLETGNSKDMAGTGSRFINYLKSPKEKKRYSASQGTFAVPLASEIYPGQTAKSSTPLSIYWHKIVPKSKQSIKTLKELRPFMSADFDDVNEDFDGVSKDYMDCDGEDAEKLQLKPSFPELFNFNTQLT